MTAEHAPLGDIMRARKEVYPHSSILRHKLNRQERAEPRSADEVLAVAQRPPALVVISTGRTETVL